MTKFKGKAAGLFGGEKFSSAALTALIIAVVMVFNALLYIVVETFGLIYYSGQRIDYSLSGATDGMFSEAISEGKKVKIYFCMAESDLAVHETGREVYITAKNFEKRYPDFIEVDFLNIITKQDKDGNYVDLSKYLTDGVSMDSTSVIFECADQHKVLTDIYTRAGFASFFTLDSSMYITSYNGEEVIASMVSWVTKSEHKKAYFTQRHGEMVDLSFTNLLTSSGYELDVIDLRANNVPDDADLLIISNPTSDFEASWDGSVYTEIDKINAFVERGGDIYVALDPYAKTLGVLEDFLGEYGIALSYSENASGGKIRNIIKDSRNAITVDGFTLVCGYAENASAQSIASRVEKRGGVLIRDTGALTLSGSAVPILTASAASVLEAGGKTVDRSGGYTVAAYSEKTVASGEKSCIFVVPSIYLAVSDSLITDGYSNKDFLFSTFEELFGATNMPYGCVPILYSSNILQNLTMGTAKAYTAAALAIPAALAVAGTVVIVRRKNR